MQISMSALVYITIILFREVNLAAMWRTLGKLHRMGAVVTVLGKEQISGILQLQAGDLPPSTPRPAIMILQTVYV